ncbi:MAG: O-methyltransferase [Planctomycetaceae bacterium]
MAEEHLWRQIIRRGWVETEDGRRLPLHSATSEAQCCFIQEQMRAVQAVRTLEIGLAYGLSALAICQELQGLPGARHIVIDPWQRTESWHGAGLENLHRAGVLNLVDFHESSAEMCLPKLASLNHSIDFAYIDAGKRLDDTIVYFAYILRMLRTGGRVVFDDAQFPGIRTALRYIVQDGRIRVVGCMNPDGASFRRRMAELLLRHLPGAARLISKEILRSDRELGIAGNCVVVEKVSDDEADWKWHPRF